MLRPFALASLIFLFVTPASAQFKGEGPGTWVAQKNPDTKDMFVTNCACEDDSESIQFTCKPKSGTVHVEIHYLTGKLGKIGDKLTVNFDIDGTKIDHPAKVVDFAGNQLPGFDASTDDPLFEALAHGQSLKMSLGAKHAQAKLISTRKAITEMKAYCAP